MVEEMSLTVSIWTAVCLATAAIVFWRKLGNRKTSDRDLPDRIILRHPVPSRVSALHKPQHDPELARLERLLRMAIFDAGARERLILDAMRTTGGDQATAIRKVLGDLQIDITRLD
jgi:hypothetical protein